MLRLRVQQVDFDAGIIRLETGTTKNKEGREVPLTPDTPPLLEACCHGKKPNDYVLTRGNPPRHVTDERDAWHNLCVATGFGHWRCKTEDCETEQTKQGRCPKCRARNWKYVGLLVHDMRRTGVRNFRRSGASEPVAMSISGHKTSATFRRYDIVCNHDKALALAALAKAQARARKARAAKPAAPSGSHKAAIVATSPSERVQ